jgi:hypothetical protein
MKNFFDPKTALRQPAPDAAASTATRKERPQRGDAEAVIHRTAPRGTEHIRSLDTKLRRPHSFQRLLAF